MPAIFSSTLYPHQLIRLPHLDPSDHQSQHQLLSTAQPTANMKTQFIAALTLLAPSVFAAQRSPVAPRSDISFVGKPIHAPESLGSFTLLFSAIDSIPTDVLEAGEEATGDYLVAHGFRAVDAAPISARALTVVEERAVAATAGILDIIKCGLAVADLILNTAIPAAKLLAVKKAIEALGGARKAAELLLKAKDIKDALKLGGEALVEIYEALMGFKDVKKACT